MLNCFFDLSSNPFENTYYVILHTAEWLSHSQRQYTLVYGEIRTGWLKVIFVSFLHTTANTQKKRDWLNQDNACVSECQRVANTEVNLLVTKTSKIFCLLTLSTGSKSSFICCGFWENIQVRNCDLGIINQKSGRRAYKMTNHAFKSIRWHSRCTYTETFQKELLTIRIL